MFKKLTLVLFVILMLSLAACGGGVEDTASTDTTQTAVGETVIDAALNAAANANGDGQVDTTPCNGIVC